MPALERGALFTGMFTPVARNELKKHDISKRRYVPPPAGPPYWSPGHGEAFVGADVIR